MMLFLPRSHWTAPEDSLNFFLERGFNFDHFGSEVRHHHGGYASGHSSGEVKDRDPIEDLRHYSPPDSGSRQPDIRRGTVILIHEGMLGVGRLVSMIPEDSCIPWPSGWETTTLSKRAR